ncbi:MAG: acyltransferase family protein [Bacteroidales bacterium]
MRLHNLDLIKGILILLVVLGHVLQGSLQDNIIRSLIYSFHMPLFIGLSGYLCNYSSLADLTFSDLIKKYLFRMILPWCIAMFVYSIVLAHGFDRIHLVESFTENFSNPYYHLWFIPAFFSWLLFSWMMSRLGLSGKKLFVAAILISLVSQIYNTYPEIIHSPVLWGEVFKESFYTLRPYNYIYFVVGMLFRKTNLTAPGLKDWLIPFSGFVIVVYLFFSPDKTINLVNSFLFNIALLYLILKLISNNKLIRIPFFEWLGINSLAIYLWHVLPLLFAKGMLDESKEWVFYPVMFVLNSILLIVYYYTSKLSFFKKYVYGLSR